MNEQTEIPEFNDDDKRETKFHDFSENKEVVGKLMEISPGTYGNQYLIDTDNGLIKVGTYEALKDKIKKADENKFIKIVLTGEKATQPGKNPYKIFEVFIRDG